MSIIKTEKGYRLVAKSTGRNLGDFDTLEAAKKHEREVEYFKHQNESMEQLEEAHKLGDRVIMNHPTLKGVIGHIGEIRHGAYKGAPKTYTIDYQHPKHNSNHTSSIQLDSKHFKAFPEGKLGESEDLSEGWIKGPKTWKQAVENKHGSDVEYKKHTMAGFPEKKSTIARKNGVIVGVYQHYNQSGTVHSGVSESEELDETVSSSSKERYQSANGKKPSGNGNWLFSTVHPRDWNPEKHKDNTVSVRGNFSDAAKEAKKQFKAKGHSGEIHVLESEELEEGWKSKIGAAAIATSAALAGLAGHGIHQNIKNQEFHHRVEQTVKEKSPEDHAKYITSKAKADKTHPITVSSWNPVTKTPEVQTRFVTDSKAVKAHQELVKDLAKKHGIKIDESEQLDELSIDTLKSYSQKAAVSANKLTAQGAKSKKPETSYAKFKKASVRLDNKAAADKKIFKKEWNSKVGISESHLAPGTPVVVNHDNGVQMTGKIKAAHGGVYEVSHRNGKVGFYHHYKVVPAAGEHINEAVTFDDIKKRLKLNPATLKSDKVMTKNPVDGMDPAHPVHKEVSQPGKPDASLVGSSLKHSSDTHRKQMVAKLSEEKDQK